MIFRKVILLFVSSLFFLSCSKSGSVRSSNPGKKVFNRAPATIEKAWLARNYYDSERRLLIPKYSGARWGSILEYTEGERLEYKDWWIRDVKMEELNPNPSTEIKAFQPDSLLPEFSNEQMIISNEDPTNQENTGSFQEDGIDKTDSSNEDEEFSFPDPSGGLGGGTMSESEETPFAPLPPGF